MPAKSVTVADKTGIASAVLCMIHCLVIPLLLVIKTSLQPGVLNLPGWWGHLDYLFLLLSLWAVYHAAGHTPSPQIRTALWLCWLVLAIAIIWESKLRVLAYIASAGLIAVHFLNLRRLLAAKPGGSGADTHRHER